MQWQYLKSNIYYLDGSLRDIYVNNVTTNDWQLWAEFINTNYKTSFHIYEGLITTEKIDFSIVIDYWNGDRDKSCMASVLIDDIIIKAYFFDNEQIENDITPKEINSVTDHNKLMDFMKGLSKVLDKPVILTPENQSGIILICVDKDDIKINIS